MQNTENPTADQSLTATQMAERVVSSAKQIIDLEAQLEAAKKSHEHLIKQLVPAAFAQDDVQQIVLSSGVKVSCAVKTYAAITDTNKVAAHAWLREHGYGDLIKTNIVISLGRGQDAMAAEVLGELNQKGVPHESKESVHFMTYKAWARETLGRGEIIPLDTLGIFQQEEASIVWPK